MTDDKQRDKQHILSLELFAFFDIFLLPPLYPLAIQKSEKEHFLDFRTRS
jgi:hypothetical protein